MRDGCVQKNSKQSDSFVNISRVAICITLALTQGSVYAAEDWFNPALVAAGGENVADLTRFAKGQQPEGVYHVMVRVNDDEPIAEDIHFTELERADNDLSAAATGGSGLYPCLSYAWLINNGVTEDVLPEGVKNDEEQCLPFTHLIEGAGYFYDFEKQSLTINIPQAMLKNKLRGYIPPQEWDDGINAGLLSYMMTGQSGSGGDSYYLNLNSGLNIGPWRLRHNGVWNYQQSGDYTYNQWRNVSTYVERNIVPLRSQVVVGDASSDSVVFDSLSFRGVRLYSDSSMLPDAMQGYAPTVKGVATARSKVTIKQHGYIVYQSWVPAGPFAINDISPSSASGDLDVSIEGSDGRTQIFTVPYSTVSMLQREGRLQYELVAGRFRSGSNSYDKPAYFQNTLQWGGPWNTTFYGGTQLSSNYTAFLLGLGRNMGDWGAISADVTSAWSELADNEKYQGQSMRFRYAKSLNDFGTNFNLAGYRYSTKGFYTLDETAYKNVAGYEYEQQLNDEGHYVPTLVAYHNLRNSKKGKAQLSISQDLYGFGSVYLSGTQQTYWNKSGRDEWYQAGWTDNWRGISWNLAYSYSKSTGLTTGDRVVSLSVSLPIGQWLSGNQNPQDRNWLNNVKSRLSVSRTQSGREVMQTGLSGTALEDRSLSYSLLQSHSNRSGDSGSANASLDGRYGTLGLGYSYDSAGHYMNWSLSGGAIAHSHGITFGQTLGDTNILVQAEGASGIPVKNRTGVKTDWRGYTILPSATNYRRNRVALDADSLDEFTELDSDVASIVPSKGAVVRAAFKTHKGFRAIIQLSKSGKVLPFGAVVSVKNSDASGIVGDDGEIFFSGLPEKGQLVSQWGNSADSACVAHYNLNDLEHSASVLRFKLNCD